VLSPFVFADWPGRRQFAQSLTHVGAIVVLLAITFGAQSDWMMRLLPKIFLELMPRIVSVADVGPYVWLLTPISMILITALGRRSPIRVAPAAVVMICGATVTAAAVYGGAGFVAAFDGVAVRGSAGFSVLESAMGALAAPSLLALVFTAATMILVIVSQWRAQRLAGALPEPAARLSGTAMVLVIASMAASLIAVNQWMLFNEQLLDVGLALSSPARSAAAGGGRVLVGRTELAAPLIILGFIIAVTMLAAAVAAWRGGLTRRPNPLLVWSTRIAVVAMFAGCVWHVTVIDGQWRTFRAEASALRSRPAPSR
jgi:hypothetical protein